VVIGASRGGVEALGGIVAALPPNLQSTLLIVLHISPTHAWAEDEDRNDKANRYVITNLDSDLKGAAAVQDTVLQNSWGVAFSPAGSPFWIADNNTGCATL
jgi:hypothetical protein